MKLIKISDIVVPEDRQRKTIDPATISDLATAIKAVGLINPILLRKGDDGKVNVLVAGETRLTTIKDMHFFGHKIVHDNQVVPDGFIPYTEVSSEDALDIFEAELVENTARKDLDWKDKADAVSKLHQLRTQKAALVGKVHHVADTAKEIHGEATPYRQNEVKQQILIAKHINNPLVAKAKSATEAVKIIVKEEAKQKLVAQAAIVGKDFNSSKHTLKNINCLDWLRTREANSVDIILTDPPYGMGADKFGDAAGKANNFDHQYDDSYESWQKLMEELCPLLFKVAKPDSFAFLFCDFDNFHELKQLMVDAGFKVFRTPLLHHKPNSGRVPLTQLGIRRSHEYILMAWKGNRDCIRYGDDVISSQADTNTSHGAQKPVALYQEILSRFAAPGMTVLDAFAGSGTIFPACHNTKTYAIGLELNPQYYAICLDRLQSLDKQETPIPMDVLLKGL